MKKFRNFINEEMSVTLKQHGSTSYKVHAVGSKMKQHGGFKVGDTVHDHHIDDLHDSGIKVRYHKEEVQNEGIKDFLKDKAKQIKKSVKDFQNSDTAAQIRKNKTTKTMEAIERKADSKMIMVKDPNTGRTVLKKAPRKEIEIGKGKMESVQVDEISDTTKVSYIKKAYKDITDKEKSNSRETDLLKKRREGVRMARGKLGEEENVQELSNALVNKVAKKRSIKTYSAAMKADGDRRDPDYQKAMSKEKGNLKLRLNRGARKMDKAMGEDYSDKEVRMGKGVAFDKRYKDGNYSGAYKTINKIKKGLADHPKVKDALRRANEEFNKGE